MSRVIPILVAGCVFSAAHARPLDPRSILKTYFETGDTPTETQFVNLIDSTFNVTPDGVEIPLWEGLQLRAANPHDDGGPDSMDSMDARVVSVTGTAVGNEQARRVLTIEFVFGNDQGLWIADHDAVFVSVGPMEFHNSNNELRWELSEAPSFSLNGDPAAGQREMTPGTYITSAPVACAADVDANGVLNIDDVDAFVDAFVGGVLLVDFDANGVLNIDDVDAFVESFLSGCA